ncbi:Transcriptional adapter ada2 [Borealophlyctis nickersoniae]|nr:Transcriptional adapter ada2 [Borealophlyctis nickersoniae]
MEMSATQQEQPQPVIPAKRKHPDDDSDIQEFGQEYHCDGCSKDISHVVRVRCAVCTEFDLCVECFSAGAEPNDTHKKDHPYRVMEILDFPLFEEDWGADEELAFVEGLEKEGIGNWEQIADHIGSKNKADCAEHYERVFIGSDSWPLPDMSIQFDPSKRRGGPAPPPKKLPKVPVPPASHPTNHEIAGYMPGRQEFEVEFDNEFESIIAEISFGEEDTPEDTELKLSILSVYNDVLDRRRERKKLIFERNLFDFRKIKLADSKRPKEERDLLTKMRVFAKMQTAQDFDLLVGDMLKELNVRRRIAELQEYRRMGLTKLRDVSEYEKEKLNRNARGAVYYPQRFSSRTKLEDPGSGRSSRATTPSRPPLTVSSTTLASPHTSPSLSRSATAPNFTPPSARKVAQPIDITGADGVELLLNNEKELCSNLRIFPKAYMVIKETILREYAAKGFMKRRQARELIKIDVNKTSRIYDFFVEMGWIKLRK